MKRVQLIFEADDAMHIWRNGTPDRNLLGGVAYLSVRNVAIAYPKLTRVASNGPEVYIDKVDYIYDFTERCYCRDIFSRICAHCQTSMQN